MIDLIREDLKVVQNFVTNAIGKRLRLITDRRFAGRLRERVQTYQWLFLNAPFATLHMFSPARS